SQRPARAGERHHELLPDDPDLRIEQPADGRPAAPGFLNGLPALANATTNCFPMIQISGSSSRPMVDLQ
ncbi:hypothetical protein GR254_25215, partial [Mycobacterium tuberculosis]|nr:hypothetical protein [Mycobacterium tuberculosis]